MGTPVSGEVRTLSACPATTRCTAGAAFGCGGDSGVDSDESAVPQADRVVTSSKAAVKAVMADLVLRAERRMVALGMGPMVPQKRGTSRTAAVGGRVVARQCSALDQGEGTRLERSPDGSHGDVRSAARRPCVPVPDDAEPRSR